MIKPGFTGLFQDNLTHLRACDNIPFPLHDTIDANGLIQRVYDRMSRHNTMATRDEAKKVIALWATPYSSSSSYVKLFLQKELHGYLEGWAHDRKVNRGLDQFQSWITALNDLADTIYFGTSHDAETLARLPD